MVGAKTLKLKEGIGIDSEPLARLSTTFAIKPKGLCLMRACTGQDGEGEKGKRI